MEKDIKKMNQTLKGLYQEGKISFSEWERTLKWYVSDNNVNFCKTCNKPKVSDGLDICFECTEKIRSGKIMTEKNKSRKIKIKLDTNRSKKISQQIQNGFDIAEKWKQQRKLQDTTEIMNLKDMAKALKLLKKQQEE